MTELYAIVGNMERARLMLDAGVPYLQLRFKETPLVDHQSEIEEWTEAYPATRLVINDDLVFAESVGAWAVHLGQEDLERYTKKQLRKTPVNLGISTHTDAEIETALRYNPVMLGFGPIFPTTTKHLRHHPQGIYRLGDIVANTPLPIVAIGGINADNLDSVLQTHVDMVAMISFLDQFSTAKEVISFMDQMKSPQTEPV